MVKSDSFIELHGFARELLEAIDDDGKTRVGKLEDDANAGGNDGESEPDDGVKGCGGDSAAVDASVGNIAVEVDVNNAEEGSGGDAAGSARVDRTDVDGGAGVGDEKGDDVDAADCHDASKGGDEL